MILLAKILLGVSHAAGELEITAGTYEAQSSFPSSSSMTVTFETDGNLAAAASLTPNSSPAGAGSNWWTGQPDTGVGTGKFVKFTKTAGADPNIGGLALNTFHEITVARAFGMNSLSGAGTRTGTFTVDLSLDGIGVDATASIVLTAIADVI